VVYDLPFGRGKQFGSNWNNATNSLLGGWQVTLIEKITSGFPVPLVDSNNASGVFFNSGGNGNNFNRPDQVADPYKPGIVAANPNPACQCFDRPVGSHRWCSGQRHRPGETGEQRVSLQSMCFRSRPGGLSWHGEPRPGFGPGFVNSDFSVIKHFALPWENAGLDFRAEMFNLFNHAQFAMPVNDRNLAGAGFGSVTNTVNNPRLVQFALKLNF